MSSSFGGLVHSFKASLLFRSMSLWGGGSGMEHIRLSITVKLLRQPWKLGGNTANPVRTAVFRRVLDRTESDHQHRKVSSMLITPSCCLDSSFSGALMR